MKMLYPLTFTPVYKDYLWGGDMLARHFGRIVPFSICAESWELADRPEGMSVVSNGHLRGQTLADLVRTYGTDLIGPTHNGGPFPLLLKLIDARERLSLQVHPDTATALTTGGEPKTEAWLILSTCPPGRVYAGVKEGVSADQFKTAMTNGSLEPLLQPVPVDTGDLVFIPGGRVHAIDAGCLILEVQQNSNTTYRVYDWDRVGADGKPRPLHQAQALQTIKWNIDAPAKIAASRAIPGQTTALKLITCPFFTIEQLFLDKTLEVNSDPRSFHAIFITEDSLTISHAGQEWECGRGTTWLIPATPTAYTLRSTVPTKIARVSLPVSATR